MSKINSGLEVVRPLSVSNLVEALLDTPPLGPYPKIGTVGEDNVVWVGKSAFCPTIGIAENVKRGQLVILSTTP